MNPLDVALLRGLRETAEGLALSDLAAQQGVDARKIRERLAELTAAGFQIEERPGAGIRLLGSSDRLVGDDLIARMGGESWVRDAVVFESTSSTNDHAQRLGRSGAAGGVLFVAENQTAGRGRFGRVWESAPHAGLWCSVLLRPSLGLEFWPRLTTAAAVGIAQGLEQAASLWVQIKWPNDLLVGGRKVAGILMETGTDVHGAPFAVLGFGINVNQEPHEFPESLRTRATSVRIASGGGHQNRPALAAAVLQSLGVAIGQVESGQFGEVLAEARRRSALLGDWVRLERGNGLGGAVVEGIAEGLDGEGRLEVRLAEGGLVKCAGGELTVLQGGWNGRAE